MTGDPDRQRSRVYAWEERFVAPRDPSSIAFNKAQDVVDAVWVESDLHFPPKVERLPRQSRSTVADATRLAIRLPEVVPSWCVLHEIAHAMSSTYDGQADGHGPVFMGLYAQLLVRYLRFPIDMLLQSLAASGIGVEMSATPVFLDAQPVTRTPAVHRYPLSFHPQECGTGFRQEISERRTASRRAR
jgi:hypothetical protein